jgi:serine/threonine-protein kinase
VQEIARGGMGVVFRAREKALGRVVALKMILAGHLASPEDVRRFHLEAEETSHLDHPNVVPIYHVGEHAGQHYFSMKLIEGGTLEDHVKGGPVDLRQAAGLTITIARAVHYAHEHGILHRDLKPGNVLIDRDGRPHVTDFGLAKHLGRPTGQTLSGAIVGTPGYMSPEQASAHKNLTTGTDVYSLGAILYDLVTGRPPFEAATALDVLVKVVQEEPVPPHRLNPQVDRDLETICLTCLNKDPQRRYGSAEALARDLERYLAGEPIQARRVGSVERVRKWVRRRPVAASLVAVLCAAGLLLALGGWVFSARLEAALAQAREARAAAEQNAEEADHQRQVAQQSEQEAQRQRQMAERNEQEARRQRQTAEQNAQEAQRQRQQAVAHAGTLRQEREQAVQRLEGVMDFLIYLNERLANSQTEPALRLEFLREGLQLAEQFRKQRGEDAAARRHTARLYCCLGDLFKEAHMPAQAQEGYARARDLLEKLAADFPQEARYRSDLALTLSRQAPMLQSAGRRPQAQQALKRAIDLQDGLAREPDADGTARQRAAEYRFTLGTFLEQQGQAAAAEEAYRAALQRQEQLKADSPSQPAQYAQLAATAATLAWLIGEAKTAEAQALLQKALQACRTARRLQPGNREYQRGLSDAYNDLAAFFKDRGLHAELPALAQQYRQDHPNNGGETYNAACWLADALHVVRGRKELPAAERQRLEEGYAVAAVRMLDRAIKEGYTDRAHMEADTDLDPLRQRPDFQRLMADLERHAPAVTPEKELQTLQQLVTGSLQRYQAQRAAARTTAERKRAEAQKPDLEAFAGKFLQLAQRRRESPAAMDALVWVLTHCDPEQVGPWAGPLRLQAVQLLQRDHLQKPEFVNVCVRFAQTPVPEAEELLRAGLERHSRQDVRGLSGLALAISLARASHKAAASDPARAQDLLRRAEKEFDRVAREFGSVNYGRFTLAEIARFELQKARHLEVGCPAQDIEGTDLDGKKLKLSDFRGKVVVLDFWADWCGWCRQMYPQEQEMVRRLKDQPFALVGVNCDDNREAVREVVKRKGLNWRSWFDGDSEGGHIRQDWHVNSFPSIWVLDHKGVIRFKDVRGPQLDAAVRQLLRELEAERSKGS